jgi:hypothetical protein
MEIVKDLPGLSDIVRAQFHHAHHCRTEESIQAACQEAGIESSALMQGSGGFSWHYYAPIGVPEEIIARYAEKDAPYAAQLAFYTRGSSVMSR